MHRQFFGKGIHDYYLHEIVFLASKHEKKGGLTQS